jgi:hypothetical protein
MSDMDITIKYEHFNGLNKNVLRLGNEVRDLTTELNKCREEIKYLRHNALALREAGDEVWYSYRHREPLADAIQEWVEVRDARIVPQDENL